MLDGGRPLSAASLLMLIFRYSHSCKMRSRTAVMVFMCPSGYFFNFFYQNTRKGLLL